MPRPWFRLRPPDPGDGPPGFERTVAPHLNAAYSLARWLTRDPTLAEDVTQEALLRALTYFPSFRGGDARAWLLRIVRNAALTALAARPVSSLDDAQAGRIADPAPSPEAALCTAERAAALTQALAALPLDLREALVLRELEELSYRQIAQIAGVPIGTVMSRLWRARQALLAGRERIAPDDR